MAYWNKRSRAITTLLAVACVLAGGFALACAPAAWASAPGPGTLSDFGFGDRASVPDETDCADIPTGAESGDAALEEEIGTPVQNPDATDKGNVGAASAEPASDWVEGLGAWLARYDIQAVAAAKTASVSEKASSSAGDSSASGSEAFPATAVLAGVFAFACASGAVAAFAAGRSHRPFSIPAGTLRDDGCPHISTLGNEETSCL